MFLEILTRTFGQRPEMLKRCKDSLQMLTDPDWKQRLIVDKEARGVEWANRNLGTIKAKGDWVWVLDDDDVCCYAGLITDLKELVAEENPDVVMVRVFHAKFGLLPGYERWGQRPIMGHYGGSGGIFSRDVWNRFRTGWTPTYAGDFWFMNDVWDAGLKIAWLPVIAAYYPQMSKGAAENAR